MEIRCLTETDAQALWDLRTTALQSEPEAFGESLEEHLQTPVEGIEQRLRSGGDESFVLGAISDSVLVGMVGFYRDLRAKRRHRAWIWGMYVAPTWRGEGIGRQLLEEVVRRAEKISGLQRLLLSVSVTQSRARHLYASVGFGVFGTEPQALQIEGRFLEEDHMGFTLKKTENCP
jgi:ribosomal protein S18 acetylase RimI-like enzyme